MDVVLLSRIQFAVAAGFHFIFPPLTLGITLVILVIETLFLKSGEEIYKTISAFLIKILGLIFGALIIIALGIIDDIRPLRARVKFPFQVLAAIIVVATGTRITSITKPFQGIGMPYILGETLGRWNTMPEYPLPHYFQVARATTALFGTLTVAVAYLAVFGSIVAFTAYVWLLHHARPVLVGSYAYVNPVIAVALGAFIAGETFTAHDLGAMVVILAGFGAVVFAIGQVVDFVWDNAFIVVDARGYAYSGTTMDLPIEPLAPELRATAPREFEITYKWNVVDALPRHAQGAGCFVHFVNSEGEHPEGIAFQNDHALSPDLATWEPGEHLDGLV